MEFVVDRRAFDVLTSLALAPVTREDLDSVLCNRFVVHPSTQFSRV
jgi:hypothetical protein